MNNYRYSVYSAKMLTGVITDTVPRCWLVWSQMLSVLSLQYQGADWYDHRCWVCNAKMLTGLITDTQFTMSRCWLVWSQMLSLQCQDADWYDHRYSAYSAKMLTGMITDTQFTVPRCWLVYCCRCWSSCQTQQMSRVMRNDNRLWWSWFTLEAWPSSTRHDSYIWQKTQSCEYFISDGTWFEVSSVVLLQKLS